MVEQIKNGAAAPFFCDTRKITSCQPEPEQLLPAWQVQQPEQRPEPERLQRAWRLPEPERQPGPERRREPGLPSCHKRSGQQQAGQQRVETYSWGFLIDKYQQKPKIFGDQNCLISGR